MTAAPKSKASILGDLRAEADHLMLASAFLETADYKTLIDTTDRPIVVGRRGTGKSAMAYRLGQHWRSTKHTDVISLSPTEEQVIGLRALIPEYFGDKYKMIRAGARNAWRYALFAEAAAALKTHYKFSHLPHARLIERHGAAWIKYGSDITMRLRRKLLDVGLHMDSSTRIAEITNLLELASLQEAIAESLRELDHQVVFLVDRVDEGYEPDTVGVAIVDALVLAAIDVNTRVDMARVTLFLRDNMARAVEQLDPDHSRDIEGQTLRLHWEESQLFSLVCSRLRIAFKIDVESDTKVWDRCTARETLQGRAGFKKCLRHTLYRPRDIIALLNDAFLMAAREGRTQIIDSDVEKTAQEISRHRLDDLHKEYSAILPGLREYTACFAQSAPDMSVAEAYSLVDKGVESFADDEAAAQTFELLNSPPEIAAALYSVGFVGVKDSTTGETAFCHDGRMLDRVLKNDDRMMIHPCYWLALGITASEVEPGSAEEIFDDYEITVVSKTPEIRRARLSQLISAIDRLPKGDDAAEQFEDLCLKALRIIFAVQLTNIEHHPNGAAVQRRDIVATNLGRSEFWKRILHDYGVRQVIFEVKNYADIGPDEFRQMLSYSTGEYGRACFIITRDDSDNLLSERELPWMKEMYTKHQRLIVKITGRFVTRILSKMRTPQRHDEADAQLNKLFDKYTRNYLGEPAGARKRGRYRRRGKGKP